MGCVVWIVCAAGWQAVCRGADSVSVGYRFDLSTLNAINPLDNQAGYIYFMRVFPIPPETVRLQAIE